MKIESVLEITMNTQGAAAALLSRPHPACCGKVAVPLQGLQSEKHSAAPTRSSSLNDLVRAQLTGGESSAPVAEALIFAVIIAMSAGMVVYTVSTIDSFMGALPQFSHFVQGCL